VCITALPGHGLSLEAGDMDDNKAFYNALVALPGMAAALAECGIGEAQHGKLQLMREQAEGMAVTLAAFDRVMDAKYALRLRRQQEQQEAAAAEEAAAAAGEGVAPAPAEQR